MTEVFLDSLIRNSYQKNTFLGSLFETEKRSKCFEPSVSLPISDVRLQIVGRQHHASTDATRIGEGITLANVTPIARDAVIAAQVSCSNMSMTYGVSFTTSL